VVVEVKHQLVTTVQQAVVARAVVLDGRTILLLLLEFNIQFKLAQVVFFQHLLGLLQQLMAVTVGFYQQIQFVAVVVEVGLQTLPVFQLEARL
jgi:hypothetical protein